MDRAQAAAGSAPPVDADASHFPVDVPGFQGSLEQLVVRAQRGEVDLDAIPVAEITATYRRRLDAQPDAAGLRELADFISLAARLVALKASRLDPAAPPENEADAEAEPTDDAGRRLAEYRLFKAAADALLAEATEEGTRSFLGLVAPEVIPVERLRIPPERLAAAFRAVLARLSENEPLPVGAVTYSVEDKMEELRARLARGGLAFDEIFSAVETRLEAVACFLALLELLRRGEATVEQAHPFGPISVTAGAPGG